MNILVACEESQAVTIELRKRGHNAFSCDIIECSGGHPEWHIKQDVLPLLHPSWVNQGDDMPAARGYEFTTQDGRLHFVAGRWDMIIGHPPCTYLSCAGAQRLHPHKGETDLRRLEEGKKAARFFMEIDNADCDRIAVENPVIMKEFGLPKYSQIIHPYYFGDPWYKRTCLWLKGVPELKKSNEVEPTGYWVQRSGKRAKGFTGGHRDQRMRSKTFPGIARAMAEQWAGKCEEAGVWIDWPSCEYICSKCGRSSELVEALHNCPNCGHIMRTNEVFPNFECFVEEYGEPDWWTDRNRRKDNGEIQKETRCG